MNILFRKHFHGEAERSFGRVGGKGGKGGGRRSREAGYTAMEAHSYRTHIFLSPPGSCQGCAEAAAETSPRRPSVTLMKWAVGGGTRRKASSGRGGADAETPTPTASRQVSFTAAASAASRDKAPPSEPVTLATLNRDCFIIPVASLDRFLPAGVPVSHTSITRSRCRSGGMAGRF